MSRQLSTTQLSSTPKPAKLQKDLRRSHRSWNTCQDFLMIPSLWAAAQETERRCFSNVILSPNVTPKGQQTPLAQFHQESTIDKVQTSLPPYVRWSVDFIATICQMQCGLHYLYMSDALWTSLPPYVRSSADFITSICQIQCGLHYLHMSDAVWTSLPPYADAVWTSLPPYVRCSVDFITSICQMQWDFVTTICQMQCGHFDSYKGNYDPCNLGIEVN